MPKTPLHDKHVALGASFTDFGGWEMPVRYSSDLAEHHGVRSTAGLFDISHMGEIFISGADAANFLNYALVGRASEIAVGRAKYSMICNSDGGIIDDLIVYRLASDSYLIIANAGNRETVVGELIARNSGFDCKVEDKSSEWALLALQGPKTVEILSRLTKTDLNLLKYYSIAEATLSDFDCYLARTGYTGEDGFEILVRVENSEKLFDEIMSAGEDLGILPAGLASRDTLRLEAGMPLYGHELSLEVNPYEAGLGKVVRLDREEDFVGKQALEALSLITPLKVLVGLQGEGKRAARADYEVFSSDKSEVSIGKITSGALSPTLGYPIAMAFVEPDFAKLDQLVSVDIRGARQAFKVISLPFYKRSK